MLWRRGGIVEEEEGSCAEQGAVEEVRGCTYLLIKQGDKRTAKNEGKTNVNVVMRGGGTARNFFEVALFHGSQTSAEKLKR